MFKPCMTGVTACAAILTAAGLAQRMANAQVQAPQLPIQCAGQPLWTEGYQFFELIPAAAGELKSATVSASTANVRRGAGMDADIAFTLNG